MTDPNDWLDEEADRVLAGYCKGVGALALAVAAAFWGVWWWWL